MAIHLPETEYVLSACRAHLKAYPNTDPAIESYLTSYVVVRMCSEIEQVVSELIRNKVLREAPSVAGFVVSFKRSMLRNAEFGEIGDKIGLFRGDLKERFQKEVRDPLGEEGISLISNAVKDRNDTRHSTPPDLTFNELGNTYESAEKMIDVAAGVLS